MDWSPFALLVIDVQNDFTNDIEDPDERLRYFDRLTALINDCRRLGVETIFVRGKYKADKLDWLNFLKYNNHPVLVEGTDGFAHDPRVDEKTGEKVVYKQALDAFIGTDLDRYLKEKNKRFLFIAGFDTSVCVLFTLMHAIQIGYWVCCVDDCCWDEDGKHERVISMYKNMIINIEKRENLFSEENYSKWTEMLAGGGS